MMEYHNQKIEAVKVGMAWTGVAGAKTVEAYHDHVTMVFGLSLTDLAALFAGIYSLMQICLLAPKWYRAVKSWVNAIFK